MWEVDDSATVAAVGEWCLARRGVDRLLVTARSAANRQRVLDEPRVDTSVEELFGDALLDSFWASRWPGTQLLDGGVAKTYSIRFDEQVLARMVEAENRLPEWHQWHEPPLPADICLYKLGDPLPAFVSITHEREAWFQAFLLDEARAPFAAPAERPLPADLIPPPPSFVRRAR